MSKDRSIETTVADYLRKINPTAVDRAPALGAVKLRRVLDSLDMVEFIAFLESTYDMRISDQDVLTRNFETVESVVSFVEAKTKAPGGA